jgi:molecular chaperone GrpE
VSDFPRNTERDHERDHEVAEAVADVAEAEAAVESDLSQLEQLEGERAELVDTLRRVQADFENYRKRVLREQTALVERATERLVEDLLPVLDSFDGALGSVASADSPESDKVREGVVGIRTQFVSVLERAGLERIDATGAAFDPNEHEAVLQDDGDGDPHVAEIMRTGYRLKGRVLRPAMVRVTREG